MGTCNHILTTRTGHMKKESEQVFYTMSQAAQMVNIPRTSLARHIAKHRISPSAMVGGNPLFSLETVMALNPRAFRNDEAVKSPQEVLQELNEELSEMARKCSDPSTTEEEKRLMADRLAEIEKQTQELDRQIGENLKRSRNDAQQTGALLRSINLAAKRIR